MKSHSRPTVRRARYSPRRRPLREDSRPTRTRPSPKKPKPKDELPEEFIGQAIKEIVMHEVGHSLGLRHNFKASTMLTADQLHDTAITRDQGLVGSVMDYCPDQPRPQGQEAGRLLHDDDRPLRLLGHRVRLQAGRRQRGGAS